MNKDLYGTASNTNNYNQYGVSNNQLPNSNTYGGPMGSNSNNNPLPNTNTYGGSFGSGANFVPNSGYQGGMGTSENSWMNSNTNNYNRFGQNSANSWYPGRDASYNYNNNNNNRYPNNNRYGNSNPFYNHSSQLTTSFLVMSFATLLSMMFY